MELSEAGEKSTGTGRTGNCVLEKHHVAEYKKKPENSELTWYFWTKVGSCSFLTYSEHGHRGERLLSCVVQIDGRRFRLSLPSVSPQIENESLFMLVFTRTRTSNLQRSLSFSATCSSICVALWCCSGIVVPHIKGPLSENLSASIPGCLVTAFPDMLQSSTRMNLSGILLNVHCPIVFQETCLILNSSCILHYRECGNPRKYSGLVYMLLICRGVNNVSITYA